MKEASEDLPETTPERYNAQFILAHYKSLRESRRPKLTPGSLCRYVVPCRVYEGIVREVSSNGGTVMIDLGHGTVVQTTIEYVIPRRVEG